MLGSLHVKLCCLKFLNLVLFSQPVRMKDMWMLGFHKFEDWFLCYLLNYLKRKSDIQVCGPAFV